MDNTNWLRQASQPLFPDMLWSRPENRRHAGKLLIIGGHAQQFHLPSQAFTAATKAGIGTARVVLPNSLQKTVGRAFPEAEFAPANNIGSFSRQALEQLLDSAEWADGVLLAGDFGKNSETAILLEGFVQKHPGQLAVSGDAIDYFLQKPQPVLSRQNTLIVADLGQLQKLAKAGRPTTAILHNMSLHELVSVLSDWSNSTPASFITIHSENIVVANGGRVSTTPQKNASISETDLAAYAIVWLLQQPGKPFEALTSAVYEISS